MALNLARPRTLAVVFGAYFLVMAVIAGYAGVTLQYHYSVDITRWSYAIYLLVGAILLVGTGFGAVWTARSLDARIDTSAGALASGDEVVEEVADVSPDDVPPPLEEDSTASGDHVDRDIDELLVSLQEMEQEAESSGEVGVEGTEARAARTTKAQPEAMMTVDDRQRLEALRKKRDSVVSFFAGPSLAAIGAIGISAAMLPGSDAFLQSSFVLNTSLLLGLGYSFVGIAAYVAASFLLLVRSK